MRQWLWSGSPRDGDLRLFCVPCAGHGASMYRTWADGLPPEIEVWALQPPGRENRLEEAPFADVTALVRDAATALEALLDNRPFAIVGHSMGALIGFELARELRRKGRPQPCRLFLSGRSAPQAGVTGPRRHDLPDALFLRSVQQLNTALAQDDEYLDAIRFMLPTLRADFTMCECYTYVEEPALPCDLSVWGGEADMEAGIVQLAGWREHTTGHFALRMFPGDHFFLMAQKKAVLRVLAEELEPLLDVERRGSCRASKQSPL